MPNLEHNIKYVLDLVLNDCLNSERYNQSYVRQEPDGGHSPCYFQGPSFSKNNLSQPTITEATQLHALIEQIKSIEIESLINALCRVAYECCLKNLLWNTDSTDNLLREEATIINQWLNTPTDTHYCYVRFFTELPRHNINEWEAVRLNCIQRTLIAHQSGINASEYLSRLASSSTFRITLPNSITKNELTKKIDHFQLTLSFALWRPIHLEDIHICNSIWENCPIVPFQFMRMHGAYKYNTRDASAVPFFSNTNVFAHEQIVDINKFNFWDNFFTNNPETYFPSKKIMNGLWDILSSCNEPEFTYFSQSINGIQNILIAMDGFIGDTPQGKGNTKYFQKLWRILISPSLANSFPRALSAKNIVGKLYSLRCELAHGGFTSLDEKIKELKTGLGDSWNPGIYNASSLGIMLSTLLKGVFNDIYATPNLWTQFKQEQSRLSSSSSPNWFLKLISKFKI